MTLATETVCAIMDSHGESIDPQRIGYYNSISELAETVRSTKNWSQGETFVFAESDERYVILHQVAPASCEMLTVTQTGVHDVLTAYRYEQEELVAQLSAYLATSP